MTHWINKVMMTQWDNCWHLFQEVQREYYDVDLDLPIPQEVIKDCVARSALRAKFMSNERLFDGWKKITEPVDGCAVTMGRSNVPIHIGIWVNVDDGGVLHHFDRVGVMFSSVPALRAAGWGLITFWSKI